MIMTKAFLYKLKGKTRNIKPVNLWIKTDLKKKKKEQYKGLIWILL